MGDCLAMEVGSRIRDGRQALRLSQRNLAARMRVSPSAVAQWETGQTLPSVANRVDLSRLLRIPLIDLMPEATRSLKPAMLDNPLLLAIVQQVLKLPPPVQEALLAQLAATTEALDGNSPLLPDKPKR